MPDITFTGREDLHKPDNQGFVEEGVRFLTINEDQDIDIWITLFEACLKDPEYKGRGAYLRIATRIKNPFISAKAGQIVFKIL